VSHMSQQRIASLIPQGAVVKGIASSAAAEYAIEEGEQVPEF
jgi:hypothetical protein